MNIFEYKIILSVILITIKANTEKVISDEDSGKNARKNKHLYNIHEGQRRFIDDLNDEEWHVSHLRDALPEQSRRSGCKEETFEEKAKKYRKMLKSDGALVEFVSSDPLPFDVKDLEPDICRIPDTGKVYKPIDMAIVNKEEDIGSWKSPTETGTEKTTVLDSSSSNTSTNTKSTTPMPVEMDETNSATTTKVKSPKADKKEGRRGDYMFSSVEYYDEVISFDASICPNDVEEIILEVDHIRNYDVQCEQILEWRILD